MRPDKSLARRISALLPRGLLARTLIILLVPMVVLQAVALQLFYGGQLDVISRRLTGALAGDIGFVASFIEEVTPEQRARMMREGQWRLGLALSYEEGGQLGPVPERPAWSPLLPLEDDLQAALRERLALPFDADWLSDPASIVIRVQLPGGVLHVEAPRRRLITSTLYVFVVWLVGAALLLALVAALFMKNQVRAIRRLAAASEAFGLGRDAGPIKPEGAREVRQAALAFNAMRERITRFVAQRTTMLAGVSHDLRTPLTRLRLGLAMLPRTPGTEADIAALTQDVEEMERLIDAYLAFARGEGVEAAREADLAALVREAAAKARRAGAAVEVEAPETLPLRLRADALGRALANLLDNARRHAGRITVSVRPPGGETPGFAEVVVDDDGPGIPEAERAEALKPFHTGSPSGTGLGLAIAHDILRAHGGELLLEQSPMGGLRARLRLPA
ncbi:ATP-binding protein [Rubritepida flocculans]|uniref:ATP-binding protein n=1 Tax=Rubritepida flocculans TaxID=182403 RepID=UPI00056248B7|nr:ATP-binding protein [Rubritepida flocculans]